MIRDILTQFHRGKVVRIVWHRIGILLLSHYNLVTQFVCKNSYSSDKSAINSLTYNSPYSHVLLPPLMVSSILGRKNDLFVLAQKLLGLFSSPDDLSADQLKNFLISLSFQGSILHRGSHLGHCASPFGAHGHCPHRDERAGECLVVAL